MTPSPDAAPALSGPVDLVALDIDGTVLTPDHQIAESTRSAVASAKAHGVRLVLASSRGPVALEPIQQTLGLRNEWFICYQGALVARWSADDPQELDILSQSPLDLGLAHDVETRATAAGLSVGRYIGRRWRVPAITQAIAREAAITGEKPVVSTSVQADTDQSPQKILVIADGPDQERTLEELARSLPATATGTFSHANYLEITAAGVTKAHGLAALTAHVGISRTRTAAIGDGLNDLALFAAVDYPIAMGQASDRVKNAARWTTSSNSENGVARALGHLQLSALASEGSLPPGPRFTRR